MQSGACRRGNVIRKGKFLWKEKNPRIYQLLLVLLSCSNWLVHCYEKYVRNHHDSSIFKKGLEICQWWGGIVLVKHLNFQQVHCSWNSWSCFPVFSLNPVLSLSLSVPQWLPFKEKQISFASVCSMLKEYKGSTILRKEFGLFVFLPVTLPLQVQNHQIIVGKRSNLSEPLKIEGGWGVFWAQLYLPQRLPMLWHCLSCCHSVSPARVVLKATS